MYLMYYSEDGRLITDEPLPSTVKVMTLPEFVQRANSFGRLRGAKYWEFHCDGLRIISKQEIPMPKINPAMYNVVAHARFRAKGHPQQIPRSTRMPAEMAAPYGVVEVDCAELAQRVAVMYHDEIKDAQDENA